MLQWATYSCAAWRACACPAAAAPTQFPAAQRTTRDTTRRFSTLSAVFRTNLCVDPPGNLGILQRSEQRALRPACGHTRQLCGGLPRKPKSAYRARTGGWSCRRIHARWQTLRRGGWGTWGRALRRTCDAGHTVRNAATQRLRDSKALPAVKDSELQPQRGDDGHRRVVEALHDGGRAALCTQHSAVLDAAARPVRGGEFAPGAPSACSAQTRPWEAG